MIKWAVWDAKKEGIFIHFDTEHEAREYFKREVEPHIDNPKKVFYGASVDKWEYESTHERLLRLTKDLVMVQELFCHHELDSIVSEMKEIVNWEEA